MSDWTYFTAISRAALEIAMENRLLISRRSGWALCSESLARERGVLRQAESMDRLYIVAGEHIAPAYRHGPLACQGGELATPDDISQAWKHQGGMR